MAKMLQELSSPEGAAVPAAWETEERPWLLMFHQLPPKPAYLRVKVWRRLQALGAVAVKNSVYVLPAGDQTQEDLQWLLREIEQEGGTGSICEARFVDGLTDGQVREMFHAARETDYADVLKDARSLAAAASTDGANGLPDRRAGVHAQVARLRRRVAEIAAIDFFGAPGRREAEHLLDAVEGKLRAPAAAGNDGEGGAMGRVLDRPDLARVAGRTWVTRRKVWVDRMASAWLIRRFIDSEARFKFVDANGYEPVQGELRFDMFEAEFTHEGDLCTFEVLLACAGLRDDPALAAIGEIVHDIDLKDGKFGREEAAGVSLLLDGIATREQDDERRLGRSGPAFDDLYESFRSRLSKTAG